LHRTREGCRLARNEPDSARSLCELLMTAQGFTTTMGSFRKIRGTVPAAVTVGGSSGRSARISLTNIARHAGSQERKTSPHPLPMLPAKYAIRTIPDSRCFRGTPGRLRRARTSHVVASRTAQDSRQIPARYPGIVNEIRQQWVRFAKIHAPCPGATICGQRTTDRWQRTRDD
jgi:hypothetical protein